MNTSGDPMQDINMYFALLLKIIAVALVLFIIGWVLASWNRAVNDGHIREGKLNAAFVDCQNHYDDMRRQVQSVLPVSKIEADRIVEACLKYNASKFKDGMNPQLYVEEVPQFSNLDFSTLNSVVSQTSLAFRDAQSRLLHELGEFESWKLGSLFTRIFCSGFPTDGLIAWVGAQRLAGLAALEKMYGLVVLGETVTAYRSGLSSPLISDAMTRTLRVGGACR